jgi:hypothetical protein
MGATTPLCRRHIFAENRKEEMCARGNISDTGVAKGKYLVRAGAPVLCEATHSASYAVLFINP